jgi:hypothetical protein
MVDLMIDNPTKAPIGSIIKTIEVEYGGQRLDILRNETQITTNAAIFKRPITHMNGKTIIPLAMAPFHEHNLVSPSTEHHKLAVNLTFQEDFTASMLNPRLFANMYYVDTPKRHSIINMPYEFATIQSQCEYDFKNRVTKGINTFKLSFNHPSYMIYFWGFDKNKVTNITFNINSKPFYNGPIEPLEHQKALRGLSDVEPTFIFFSNNGFDEQLTSSINFSRIDYMDLIITTDQEEETDLSVAALNIQGYRHSHGMFGLIYSK